MPSKKPSVKPGGTKKPSTAPDRALRSHTAPTKVQLAWAGGILIGIGNISNGKPRADEQTAPLLLQMNSQDEWAMKAFAKIMSYYVPEGRKYKGVPVYQRKVGKSETFTIYLTNERAASVLRPLYGYISKSKRGQQMRESFEFADLTLKGNR